MRDYFMGVEVELEELALGDAGPDVTPPQGVIITQIESDGWTRRYLYKSSYDTLGSRKQSKIMLGEVRPDPALEGSYEAVPQQPERQVRFSRPASIPTMGTPFGSQVPLQVPGAGHRSSPVADNRLSLPPGTAVPFLGRGHMLGQVPTAPAAAPIPSVPTSDNSIPLANGVPAAPAAPSAPAAASSLPALPDCTRALQLPDGTVINPDDAITLKDFCAMVPWLENLLQKNAPAAAPNGPVRPGGPIPLSTGFPGLPSFGPAGGGFSQGGFGGGGGGGGGGFGPLGVVSGPAPVGGGQGQATQGPPGPAGPAGPPGAANIDGIQKTDGNFQNIGAMMPIPGLSLTATVGADGKLAVSFSFILQADFPGDSIYDVFAGIQIDSTQYTLWRNSEEQGAGGDKVFTQTATGTLFISGLTPGDHTISAVYGDNPVENHFTVVTSSSQPASLVVQHS